MIKYSDKSIKIVNAGTVAIGVIYKGFKKIWQLNPGDVPVDVVKSCFAQGFWINKHGWTNDQGWKNN